MLRVGRMRAGWPERGEGVGSARGGVQHVKKYRIFTGMLYRSVHMFFRRVREHGMGWGSGCWTIPHPELVVEHSSVSVL